MRPLTAFPSRDDTTPDMTLRLKLARAIALDVERSERA